VKAANRLFDPEHWTEYAVRVERAARLAQQLRDRELVNDVLKEIEGRVVQMDGNDPLHLSCRLMAILHDFCHGDPASMRDIAAKGARLAEGRSDFERARTWYDLVGRWCRHAGDAEGEKAAKVAVAKSLRRQAEQLSRPEQGMLAAHFLEKAHEAYRNIPGMGSETKEVYTQLRECQQRSVQCMGRITTTKIPNASELIEGARNWVAGKPLREALLALATVIQVTDFEQETRIVRELMEKYPFQYLFGSNMIDHSGRVIGHMRGAFTTNNNEFDKVLWDRVVQNVILGYQLDAQTGVYPAINQLTFEHSLRLEDMMDMVTHNPFIPPGREELFAKGFLAGFQWNFAENLSILVPQLENSLRHILDESGCEIMTRDKHGLDNFIQMGKILSDRRQDLEMLMGTDIVRELRVLFLDQNGPDLRNRIAHGLMSHDDFFAHASIYAWWFIFHLTICPVRNRFAQYGEVTEDAVDQIGSAK